MAMESYVNKLSVVGSRTCLPLELFDALSARAFLLPSLRVLQVHPIGVFFFNNDFPLSILACRPPRFAHIGSFLMKSLLKQALAQCQFTNVTKDSNILQRADERKKQKSLTRNRRAGQLKRLRNERYKRSHTKPQSWKAVQTKKGSKLKPVSRNPVTESKGIDPKLKSLARTIVQSRHLLFESAPQRVCPQKPDSALFTEKKFRDYGLKVKDIVCS
ncbi:uncharacterized protein DEA37_0001262 [Paragonimus westermani]|uniref:Uncharacterized protein n=1 Tax=Paragonimus westermani TaxID=34504 RepID=A0A5J4NF15_9TREM|nr:uncharacterized protein DEA37_0001262 [Paragonimus westermani]